MFERFTDRARRLVVLAQEASRSFNHNHIGTEHILLGMLSEGEGLAGRTLQALHVSPESIRTRLQERVGVGTETPQGHIPFTPRAKKTIELSLREAMRLGHNYISTEHLLLGILREGQGLAVQILSDLGISIATVETALMEQMRGTRLAQAAGAETSAVPPPTPPPSAAGQGPRCPQCHLLLENEARYRILEVPIGGDGDARASVLFVYCRTCGTTLDSLIAPEEQ